MQRARWQATDGWSGGDHICAPADRDRGRHDDPPPDAGDRPLPGGEAMKLIEYFKEFLTNTVNLKPSKLEDLDERVPTLTEVVKGGVRDTTVLDAIPQGSWAHETIIQPAEGLEFDADFLVQLDEVEDWAPTKYNDVVWDVLSNHGVYGSKTTRKNRCVRVTYANDCHIDIVPYVVQADGTEAIVNRTTDEFEKTNPIGFTEWLQKKDSITGGDLRKVIRLLKYLRDHRGAFAIKSILLTTVVGERVEQWRKDNDAAYYVDIPTTLLHVIKDLDDWLQARPTKALASISDPSCENTTFDHRWTDKQYETFRDDIHDLAAEIEAAYATEGVAESLAAWQDIFGTDFKAPATTASAAAPAVKSLSTSGYIARDPRASGEDFIDDLVPVDLRYWVQVDAEVSEPELYNRRQRRAALRARANRVPPGRKVTFKVVSTNVPQPYEVRWKVRNRGFEAKRRNCERGSIFVGGDQHIEPTAFKGPHYVECYIVKEGVCVAVGHVPVHIVFTR